MEGGIKRVFKRKRTYLTLFFNLRIFGWYLNNGWWWKPLIDEKVLHPTPWKLRW